MYIFLYLVRTCSFLQPLSIVHAVFLLNLLSRFYQRIAQRYRKEGWKNLLAYTLRSTFDCARSCGNRNIAMETSLELLNHGIETSPASRAFYHKEMLALLDEPADAGAAPLCLELSPKFIKVSFAFRDSSTYLDEAIAFQLILEGCPLQSIRFARVKLIFNNTQCNLIISDVVDPNKKAVGMPETSDHQNTLLQLLTVDPVIGTNKGLQRSTDLELYRGFTHVLDGYLTVAHPHELRIESCVLVLEGKCGRSVELKHQFSGANKRRVWVRRLISPQNGEF
jgi:hypothetical protein